MKRDRLSENKFSMTVLVSNWFLRIESEFRVGLGMLGKVNREEQLSVQSKNRTGKKLRFLVNGTRQTLLLQSLKGVI